jgi:hypothetical protein
MDALLSDNWGGPVWDKNSMSPKQFAEKVGGPLNTLLAQATYRRVIRQP